MAISLTGALGLSVSAWRAGINAAQATLNRFQLSILRTNSTINTLGGGMGRSTRLMHSFMLGAQGSARTVGMLSNNMYTLLPLITSAAFGQAVRWASNYEQALRGVVTMIDSSINSMSEMQNLARRGSEAFGTDQADFARAMKKALSTNVKKEELDQFMEDASNLATASQIQILDSVNLLVQLKNAYGLTAKEMAPLNDVIFAAAKLGGTEIEDMANSLGRAIPLARAAGLSITELFAAVATASLTMSPEQAMTGMRNALTDIIDPTSSAQKAIKALGVDMTPAAIKVKTFGNTLKQLKEAQEKDPRAIADMAEDIRSLTVFMALANEQFDDYNRIVGEIEGSTGDLKTATTLMLDGPMTRWERMWVAVKNAAAESGTKILDSIFEIIGASGNMLAIQYRIQASIKSVEMAFKMVWQASKELFYYGLSGFRLISAAAIEFWGYLKVIWYWMKDWGISIFEKWNSLVASAFEAIGSLARSLGLDGVAENLESVSTGIAKWNEELRKDTYDARSEMLATVSGLGEEWDKSLSEIVSFKEYMGLDEGRGEILKLMDEIKNLQELADLAAWAAEYTPPRVLTDKSVKEVFGGGPTEADKAKFDKEQKLAELRDFVDKNLKELQRWHTDSEKSYGKNFNSFKKALSAARAEYNRFTNDLIALDKDRSEFNRDVDRDVFSVKREDMSKYEQANRLKKFALNAEGMGNQALGAGDWEEAKRYAQEAMRTWKELLDLNPSRRTRRYVTDQLERLQGEMNEVYDKERSAMDSRRVEAYNIMAEAQAALTQLQSAHDSMNREYLEITRMWDDAARKGEQVVKEVAARLAEFLNARSLMIELNTDPANKKLDELEARLAALGVIGLELSTSAVEGQSYTAPENREYNRKMASEPSAGTTINLGGVTINHKGSGNQDLDAQRMARELNRHIKRGQAAPLGGK